MNYQTIAEIYEGNAKVREKLKSTINGLTDEQLNFRAEENSWTICEIVEHLSIVENGMATISSRLLQKSVADNLPNDGTAHISPDFLTKAKSVADRRTHKLSAPEKVIPCGKVSVADSLAKMEHNAEILNVLREGLETVNTQNHKFPHPAFGDLNATEWVALIGGHERRHIDQIEEILKQQK